VDNNNIFTIILIEGSGVFLPFSGEKGVCLMNRSEIDYVRYL
jgi:hypothetical protein